MSLYSDTELTLLIHMFDSTKKNAIRIKLGNDIGHNLPSV